MLFNSIYLQKQAKLTYGGKAIALAGNNEKSSTNGLWDAATVLCLDLGAGYIGAFTF